MIYQLSGICPEYLIGIYMQSVLKKIDDFIPLGSQKTPRVPFKVNNALFKVWLLDYKGDNWCAKGSTENISISLMLMAF